MGLQLLAMGGFWLECDFLLSLRSSLIIVALSPAIPCRVLLPLSEWKANVGVKEKVMEL